MRCWLLPICICLNLTAIAQHKTAMPHGMVYGVKPDTMQLIPAWRVEAFMAKKVRISTTIRGRIIKVTKTKGGWFQLDAGKGKIIAAHFKNYNITIPTALTGKIVFVEGVAEKQFIADDLQHFAGDTVRGKKQHAVKTDPKRRLIFEVKGLMVD
jgi:RecJ-like exonuclease